jgi:archaetidylinositol phosphate synthase
MRGSTKVQILQRSPVQEAREARRTQDREAPAFKSARRDQESLSSRLERRVLVWLAERTPACLNSDHLTGLGSVSMFLAGASYAIARWNHLGLLGATLCLVLNWLGDSLDGTLARVRNRQRPRYGFYVDHMLDTFGALFLTSGLAISGHISWPVAAGMLVAFLILSIEVYLATYTLGVFQLSFWKFGPTELRLLLVTANLVLWYHPTARAFGTSYRLLDFGGCIAIAAMAVTTVIAAALHIRRLYREESLVS